STDVIIRKNLLAIALCLLAPHGRDDRVGSAFLSQAAVFEELLLVVLKDSELHHRATKCSHVLLEELAKAGRGLRKRLAPHLLNSGVKLVQKPFDGLCPLACLLEDQVCRVVLRLNEAPQNLRIPLSGL